MSVTRLCVLPLFTLPVYSLYKHLLPVTQRFTTFSLWILLIVLNTRHGRCRYLCDISVVGLCVSIIVDIPNIPDILVIPKGTITVSYNCT